MTEKKLKLIHFELGRMDTRTDCHTYGARFICPLIEAVVRRVQLNDLAWQTKEHVEHPNKYTWPTGRKARFTAVGK